MNEHAKNSSSIVLFLKMLLVIVRLDLVRFMPNSYNSSVPGRIVHVSWENTFLLVEVIKIP